MTRRRKILLAAVAAGVALLFVALRLSANRIVWSRIASSFREKFGVDFEIDDLSLSFLSGRATARGLRVTDEGTPVIEADEVETVASIRDVIGGTYDFHEFNVRGLVVHVVVEQGEVTNLGRIYARRKPSPGPADLVHFRDAHVVDGRCLFDDAVTDPAVPAHYVFESVELALAEMQISGDRRPPDPGDFRLDALLSQKGAPARVTMIGWGRKFAGEPTFAMHAAVTGLDLAQIPQYVNGTTRFALGGDVMNLVGSMRVRKGVILDGAIAGEVVATGAELPLRFGGTTSDVVFDQNSRLAAIFHLPFARIGHMGDVALTSTWGIAVDLGTGLYGAGGALVGGVEDTVDGMVRLDPLGALAAAGGGVIGGAKALGEGILGGIRRIIGGGDSPADSAKEAAKQQVEFSALHAKRRRAMLDAALVSAQRSSGERRARIEKELQSAPPASVDAQDGAPR